MACKVIGPGVATRVAIWMEQPHQQAIMLFDLLSRRSGIEAQHPIMAGSTGEAQLLDQKAGGLSQLLRANTRTIG